MIINAYDLILCSHSILYWQDCYMLYDIQFDISFWWIYSGPNLLPFCLPSFYYKPFVSSLKVFWYLTLIHAWLYLTYVILDGACLSIISWYILHQIYLTLSLLYRFCSKDIMYAGWVVGVWHQSYVLRILYRDCWSRLLVCMLLLRDGLSVAKYQVSFVLLWGDLLLIPGRWLISVVRLLLFCIGVFLPIDIR